MFLLRISKSTKDGTVCLPSPLRVTVNELKIYTDFLSNPGSVLGKYEEIDKANDILCSTSLIDHKKIIYARNDLLVNNGLDSIYNGLLPSIFCQLHCYYQDCYIYGAFALYISMQDQKY